MKRIIIALLLLCISFGYCFFSYKVLKEKNNEFQHLISECQSYIITENKKAGEQKINETTGFWADNRKLYRILVDGSYCEKIAESLGAAKNSFNINETSDAVDNLYECKATLNHILEKEKLSYEAIF